MSPAPASQSSPGRIAAVDFGTRRIGIALSDPQRILASPHETYTRGGPAQDAAYFRRLAEQQEIVLFVVGLPLHMSGDESQKSGEARAFGRWLAETTGIEVEYFDERYSSREADLLLDTAGATKKRRRQHRDSLAAQIILASYLERG